MTPQMSLAYSPSYTGGESWKNELEAIRSAVHYLGLKEVSFALDVSGSAVSDALNERDRKRWAAEWTHVLIAMLVRKGDDIAESMILAIEQARVAITPFVIEERKALTPEQLAAAYERELRSLGQVGEGAIARVHRGARR